MKLKYLVLGALLFCTFVKANNLDQFIGTMSEQEKAVVWVRESTNLTISNLDATKIVKEAYANAYSKNIDPILVLAVMRNESNFVIKAKSKDGSRGLMQVIPYWHKDKLAGRDPLVLETSIDVGTWVLRDCLVKHKSNVLNSLSCYSGGGGKVYHNKVMKFKVALTKSLNQNSTVVSKL